MMARSLCVLCMVLGVLVGGLGGGVALGDARLDALGERVEPLDGMSVRVSGVARLSDGSPAGGATVTLMAHGGSAVAEADGSFVIEARVPMVVGEVSVWALLDRDHRQWVGTVTEVVVGGGEAEVGVVVMGDLCEPGWVEGVFCQFGFNNAVTAAVTWDDGTGEALYVGGSFTMAGCEVVNSIARWDGSSWSALTSSSGNGLGGQILALAVFDDGSGPALYAGGTFFIINGVTLNHIARWDGSEWSALSGPGGAGVSAGGATASVFALTVFDDGTGPALYVGGSFNTAGGVLTHNIARWDGSSWSALTGPGGTGAGWAVRALTVFDDGTGPALYVGGQFTTAGGVTVNQIARWDGSSWSALSGPGGTGVNATVYALTVFDDGTGLALYAGGNFNMAGGVTVNRIARWDGSSWSALTGPGGTGVSGGVVNALTVFDDGAGPELYVGGSFNATGGVNIGFGIARWDGSSWSALTGPGEPGVNATVYALTVFDDGGGAGPALYAGGAFSTASGVGVNRIARWKDSSWMAVTAPGSAGVDLHVRALTVFDDGTEAGPALYAGGSFSTAGGVTVNRIARWDGSSWSALTGPGGTGMNDWVLALTVFDDGGVWGPALYAGGVFSNAGGVTANRVARWDGSSWSALTGPGGSWVNNSVLALTAFDHGTGPALYAGGVFSAAGGLMVHGIARWDGSLWSALPGPGGTGVNNEVRSLTVFDDGAGPALYAGGLFTTAGGKEVNRIARWDGSSWSALISPGGTGVGLASNNSVNALTVFDDGTGPALYVGGFFSAAGGVTVNNIARWDGSSWSALSGPGGTGVNGDVSSLTVFDDGTGPALYAGGGLTIAGGVTVNGIARWDGTEWSALTSPGGTGVNNVVRALVGFDDGTGPALYAGGTFTTAGEALSLGIAKWQACTVESAPCAGDLNGDGVVDADDLKVVLGAFGLSDEGDLNGDGVTDTDDLGILLGAFGSVCE